MGCKESKNKTDNNGGSRTKSKNSNASTNKSETRTGRKSERNTDIGIEVHIPFQIEKHIFKLKCNGSVLKEIKQFCSKSEQQTHQEGDGPSKEGRPSQNMSNCQLSTYIQQRSKSDERHEALIFDHSHSYVSKGFIKKLQEALYECKIKEIDIKYGDAEKSERAITIHICLDDDTALQAVDKYLDGKSKIEYENTILVVMQLEHYNTAIADKYQSVGLFIYMRFQNTTDELETERSNALQTIKDFFAKLEKYECAFEEKVPLKTGNNNSSETCSSSADKIEDVPCILALPDMPLVKICFQALKNDLEKENISITEMPLEQIETLNNEKYIMVYMHGSKLTLDLDDHIKFIGKDTLEQMALIVLRKENGPTCTRHTRDKSEIIHSKTAIRDKDPSASPASTLFVEQFQYKMEEIGISIEKIDASKVSSLKQDAFLILVCNISTRIIPDIDKCLGYIGSGQLEKTVVVVLHIGGSSHYFPKTDGIPNDDLCQKLNDVLEVVHMTFEIKEGIHTNDLNSNAYKKLIARFGQNTSTLPKKKQSGKRGIQTAK